MVNTIQSHLQIGLKPNGLQSLIDIRTEIHPNPCGLLYVVTVAEKHNTSLILSFFLSGKFTKNY